MAAVNAVRIGVVSDTHLMAPTESLRLRVEQAFAGINTIFHAGDLTDLAVLEAFGPRTVFAVHGNMCDARSRKALPESRVIELGGFSFGLAHGAMCPRHSIEQCLWNHFGPVDCIVYGHTHQPVCRRSGPMLFVNPGSFTGGSRYGAPATYGVIEVGQTLRAGIYEIR